MEDVGQVVGGGVGGERWREAERVEWLSWVEDVGREVVHCKRWRRVVLDGGW